MSNHDTNSKSKTLFALTSAAMGLGLSAKPTIAAIEEGSTLSVQGSFYAEDDIDAEDQSAQGSPERYEIPTAQIRFRSAVSDETEVIFTYAGETLSGASPWYVQPVFGAEITEDLDDTEVEQVTSGATIDEERHEYGFSFRQYHGDAYLGLNFGYSTENDYKSASFGVNGSYSFNDKATTLELAVSANDDEIEPNGREIFSERVEREDKDAFNALIGVTQIVNKDLVVNTSLSFARFRGFLSDPYKLVWLVDRSNVLADSRPDNKAQIAWNLASRYFVEQVNAAVHADYRFYTNDWGVISHTIDLGWYQNFFENQFILAPQIRFYTQSSAEFYSPFFLTERRDGFYTSDYRLSEYTSVSGQLKASVRLEKFNIHASFERYTSFGDNPGLVNFNLFTAGFDVKF